MNKCVSLLLFFVLGIHASADELDTLIYKLRGITPPPEAPSSAPEVVSASAPAPASTPASKVLSASAPAPASAKVIPDESDTPAGALVGEAISQSGAASEKTGVEYYGKERTGILGNRLWFADIGAAISNSDDDNPDLDTGLTFSTGFNFPVAKHIDFGLGASYTRQTGTVLVRDVVYYTVYDRYYYRSYYGYYYSYYAPRRVSRTIFYEEDYEATTFSGNATVSLSLNPDKPVNPFIMGGLSYVNKEIDCGRYSDSLSEGGYAFGGGIEFMLGQKVSLIPSVLYSEAGDAKETSVGALLSYWFAFRHAFRIGGAYGTKSENIAATIGWMYGF